MHPFIFRRIFGSQFGGVVQGIETLKEFFDENRGVLSKWLFQTRLDDMLA